MTIAVYPGSFDPVTNGHMDIVMRASSIFEKLIVGVYAIPAKNLLFNTEERVGLFKQAVKGLRNVEVRPYTGLTVDLARECNAQVLLRGLRSGSDFDNEFEMVLMNQKLAPDVDSVFMISMLEHQFLSSSLLKEVAQLGGNIEEMVPKHVATALREKFGIGHTGHSP
ncbi:MAG: pantetheine-phosphate adenylyltransferase [Dehalococcoidia bacterium]|nr:pantetheine-phosphate adenylyltransferase [Dehalococcoidia bacterium]